MNPLRSLSPGHFPPRAAVWRAAARCVMLTGLWCGLAFFHSGCALTSPAKVTLPAKHKFNTDQLLVRSDIKLPQNDPLIKDLLGMRRQVSQALDLPLNSRPVHVYLFGSEEAYRKYWTANFPNYPLRRAYFVQTPDRELAVYTYWGDRIQEDLRHEFTHGLLHSATENVPLWLDEGIAEYFEIPGKTPGGVKTDDVHKLALAMQNGWRPDLDRLEKLEKVEQMQRTDYREAWAWVHFMLHSSTDSREVLLSYLKELRTDPNPPPLSQRLRSEIRDVDQRMLSYLGGLGSHAGRSNSAESLSDPDDPHATAAIVPVNGTR